MDSYRTRQYQIGATPPIPNPAQAEWRPPLETPQRNFAAKVAAGIFAAAISTVVAGPVLTPPQIPTSFNNEAMWHQPLSEPHANFAALKKLPIERLNFLAFVQLGPATGTGTMFETGWGGPTFTKTVLAQSLTGATPVETITLDKWFRPLANPVRVKLRSPEYQAFTYGATPIVNNVDQWWANLAVPPKAPARTIEYPSFVIGPTPIIPPVSGWYVNLATPPKAAPRAAEYPSLAFVAQVSTEVVTVDKWFSPLSERNVKSLPRAAEYQAFTLGPTPIIPGMDSWWRPLSNPPKAKPRAAEYPSYFSPNLVAAQTGTGTFFETGWGGPTFTKTVQAQTTTVSLVLENVTVDKWFANLATPPKAPARTVEYPAFTFGTYSPIVPSIDGWLIPWSEPSVKARLRTADYPAFTYGPLPIVSTVDRWLIPLELPPKGKPRAAEYPAFFFDAGGQLESVTLDKWYNPFSEPRVKSLLRTADYPAFTFGQLPIVSTVDRWWRNFDTPPLKAWPRTAEFQAFAFGPTPIIPSLTSWWQPWTTPPPPKPGLIAAHQQSLLYTTFTPTGVRRPFTKGYIIV